MSWYFNHAPLHNIQNAGSVFALQMAATGSQRDQNHALRAEALSLAAAASNTLKASLPSLLRAEALTGSTYERDLNTLRPDYTYFSSKTAYLLVEDSSQEYQPAHTKVFESRLSVYNDMLNALESDAKGRETTVLANNIDWPVLFGGQEGRTAFSRPAPGYCPPLPNLDLIYQTSANANANKENLGGQGKKGKMPSLGGGGGGGTKANTLGVSAPSLRRSASMNALNQKNGGSALNTNTTAGVTTRLRSKQQARSINLDSSFQAASGNSQIISSNLASATSTTTTRSGQIIGGGSQSVNNGGRNSLANGIIVDKRLARLGSKAGKHIVTLGSTANNNNNSAGSSTSSLALAAATKTSAFANPNGMPAGPATMMKRSLSLDAGLNRLKPIRPPREEVKKPGYCENCRVRYDDFKAVRLILFLSLLHVRKLMYDHVLQHTKSKKHRRFALDPNNWTELDELIADHIQRPILPELLELYQNAETEVPSDIEASDDSDSEMDGEEEAEDEDDFNEDGDDYSAVNEAQLNHCGFEPATSFFRNREFLDHLHQTLKEQHGVEEPDADDPDKYSRLPSENTLSCLARHVAHATKPSSTCSIVCHIAMRYAAEYVAVQKEMDKMDRPHKRWMKGDQAAIEEALQDSEDSDEDSDSEEEDAMQDDTDEEDEDDEEDQDDL
jgi:hypothetical protein